jgi:hypothetical protein
MLCSSLLLPTVACSCATAGSMCCAIVEQRIAVQCNAVCYDMPCYAMLKGRVHVPCFGNDCHTSCCRLARMCFLCAFGPSLVELILGTVRCIGSAALVSLGGFNWASSTRTHTHITLQSHVWKGRLLRVSQVASYEWRQPRYGLRVMTCCSLYDEHCGPSWVQQLGLWHVLSCLSCAFGWCAVMAQLCTDECGMPHC